MRRGEVGVVGKRWGREYPGAQERVVRFHVGPSLGICISEIHTLTVAIWSVKIWPSILVIRVSGIEPGIGFAPANRKHKLLQITSNLLPAVA